MAAAVEARSGRRSWGMAASTNCSLQSTRDRIGEPETAFSPFMALRRHSTPELGERTTEEESRAMRCPSASAAMWARPACSVAAISARSFSASLIAISSAR